MVYFARMIFFLKNSNEPLNLTETPKPLFSKGNAICFAAHSKLYSPSGIVFSYGPFSTQEEAKNEGINLNRLIKISMLEKGISISQEAADGLLDSTGCSISYNGYSDCENLIQLFAESHQENARRFPKRIMNECYGIGIYEVEHSLDEIMFVGGCVRTKTRIEISLQNRDFPYWDEKMDVSLAYLNASEEARDSRVKLLLRIMAIEVLVSKEELWDTQYIEALAKLKSEIKRMAITQDIINRLLSQIGNMEKKSVHGKVNDLLSTWLPNNTYCGETVFKFFDRCYSARSKLIHAGQTDAEIGKLCDGLKELSLDLLNAKSKSISYNACTSAAGMDTENDTLHRG